MQYSRFITKFIGGYNNFGIQTLRRSNSDIEDKHILCSMINVLEDEKHVLYECNMYANIRSVYLACQT